ncbi:hypothetical protein Bbelb_109100 [Branchiostoma belcheri]|nr:hypothetical protein Bbelb_109100 [Branchiostoma belcheri]
MEDPDFLEKLKSTLPQEAEILVNYDIKKGICAAKNMASWTDFDPLEEGKPTEVQGEDQTAAGAKPAQKQVKKSSSGSQRILQHSPANCFLNFNPPCAADCMLQEAQPSSEERRILWNFPPDPPQEAKKPYPALQQNFNPTSFGQPSLCRGLYAAGSSTVNVHTPVVAVPRPFESARIAMAPPKCSQMSMSSLRKACDDRGLDPSNLDKEELLAQLYGYESRQTEEGATAVKLKELELEKLKLELETAKERHAAEYQKLVEERRLMETKLALQAHSLTWTTSHETTNYGATNIHRKKRL